MGERRKFNPPFLRQWRKRAGLSQEQLAEMIGCSPALVSMIERGQRQYDQEFLEAAAEALDATPDMLLRIDPENPAFEEAAAAQLRRVPEADRARLLAMIDAFTSPPNGKPISAGKEPKKAPRRRRAG
ncbi:MAG: helix-turn-helix transcriptional regulator [Hyphomonadaceae bacterium]|nr:helix-turn-helix transcriptional regulator [Hyphomonadaceae bacterium]